MNTEPLEARIERHWLELQLAVDSRNIKEAVKQSMILKNLIKQRDIQL